MSVADGVRIGILLALLAFSVLLTLRRNTTQIGLLEFVAYLWFWLVVSEFLMFRSGNPEDLYEQRYGLYAYLELGLWAMLAMGALFAFILFPSSFRKMLRPPLAVLTLYMLVVAGSVFLSPNFSYSLAWAIKLIAVVLILLLMYKALRTPTDVQIIMKVVWWAFLVLTFFPLVQLVYGFDNLWTEEGRLGGFFSPMVVSMYSAIFVTITLFYRYEQKGVRFYLPLLLGALMIMVLGGGKTAIAAGLFAICLMILNVSRHRILSSLGFLFLFTILLTLSIILNLPLTRYIEIYEESGALFTLTGRLVLWGEAIPRIGNHLLFGHGYAASRFFGFEYGGLGPTWPYPASMHNSFLETLYNNGIVGFALVGWIHVSIIQRMLSLRRMRRLKVWREGLPKHLITLFAPQYIFLAIHGQMNADFGGKVYAPFILLLTTFVLLTRIDEMNKEAATTSVATSV